MKKLDFIMLFANLSNIGDVITTYVGVIKMGFVEMNPFIKYNIDGGYFVVMAFIKIILVYFMLGFFKYQYLKHMHNNKMLSWFFKLYIYIIYVAFTFVFFNNWIQIMWVIL